MPPDALVRGGLTLFRLLPARLRRGLVRLWAPSFTVGAVCVIVDGDRVLLVRQAYRRHWTAPGGLLQRREAADAAAVRETREEVGLDVEVSGNAVPIVWPHVRRVDIAYPSRLRDGAHAEAAAATSPEIEEVRWFGLDALPPLQRGTAEALRLLGLARPPG